MHVLLEYFKNNWQKMKSLLYSTFLCWVVFSIFVLNALIFAWEMLEKSKNIGSKTSVFMHKKQSSSIKTTRPYNNFTSFSCHCKNVWHEQNIKNSFCHCWELPCRSTACGGYFTVAPLRACTCTKKLYYYSNKCAPPSLPAFNQAENRQFSDV